MKKNTYNGMRKNVYTVDSSIKGKRLDSFISLKSHLTRSFIQKIIRQGFVTVNLRKEKAGFRLKEGDLIEMLIPDEPEAALTPEDIPLEILWEDEHIVVVNKPPDMVVYPAAGNRSGTMMNALSSRCKKLASVGAPLRPGVVHRLDKDTSGAIIVAKDDASHHELVRQFKEREVEKYYLALLYGNIREDSGEIKAAIGRSLSDRKKMSVRTGSGKEAVTRFEVIERFKNAALVKVRILTGRTHQIRVHFASLNRPVLGDKTYGKKTSVELGTNVVRFSRQMLHAYILKLKHPATGKTMKFKAPMPEDMERAVEELRTQGFD